MFKLKDETHLDLNHVRENTELYKNYFRLAMQLDEEHPEGFEFLKTWHEDTPGLSFSEKIKKIKESDDDFSQLMIFWFFWSQMASHKHRKEITKILFPNLDYPLTGLLLF